MKTNNQTGRTLLELAINKAANEDGISPSVAREGSASRRPSWSPAEVWRTRVKPSAPRERNRRTPA